MLTSMRKHVTRQLRSAVGYAWCPLFRHALARYNLPKSQVEHPLEAWITLEFDEANALLAPVSIALLRAFQGRRLKSVGLLFSNQTLVNLSIKIRRYRT